MLLPSGSMLEKAVNLLFLDKINISLTFYVVYSIYNKLIFFDIGTRIGQTLSSTKPPSYLSFPKKSSRPVPSKRQLESLLNQSDRETY